VSTPTLSPFHGCYLYLSIHNGYVLSCRHSSGQIQVPHLLWCGASILYKENPDIADWINQPNQLREGASTTQGESRHSRFTIMHAPEREREYIRDIYSLIRANLSLTYIVAITYLTELSERKSSSSPSVLPSL